MQILIDRIRVIVIVVRRVRRVIYLTSSNIYIAEIIFTLLAHRAYIHLYLKSKNWIPGYSFRIRMSGSRDVSTMIVVSVFLNF